MKHYPFLDPEVKRRARERGLDIERLTSAFLNSIRKGTGMRPRLAAQLDALMTGPPLSLVEATDEWYRRDAQRELRAA